LDTFIVRIYRHTARAANELAGTIEHVESGERDGFASASELLDRLLVPRTGPLRSTASTERTKLRGKSSDR